ncbi:hypothetical protein GOODEAATRI_000602, partial [Goodea atripinnis]
YPAGCVLSASFWRLKRENDGSITPPSHLYQETVFYYLFFCPYCPFLSPVCMRTITGNLLPLLLT